MPLPLTQAAWTQVSTKTDLAASGGKQVVETSAGRVLLAEVETGQVFATSNKCPHLGLPLVGKTALLQGQIKDGKIFCPAHGSAFDLASGAPKGEWCPKMPNLPFVGKMGDPAPLPTFESRVDGAGNIEVLLP